MYAIGVVVGIVLLYVVIAKAVDRNKEIPYMTISIEEDDQVRGMCIDGDTVVCTDDLNESFPVWINDRYYD